MTAGNTLILPADHKVWKTATTNQPPSGASVSSPPTTYSKEVNII